MARSTKKETPAEELQTDSPTETPSPTEEQQVEVIDVAVDGRARPTLSCLTSLSMTTALSKSPEPMPEPVVIANEPAPAMAPDIKQR